MITKLVYFRPEKRFVREADLELKYSCLVKDEFTKAENQILVPSYLTVLQHHIPKVKPAKRQQKQQCSTYQFAEKICFFLIGSGQTPLLTELVTANVQNVDRIEFKGHIGFEQPVFGILGQFPVLRKVSFLIQPCKQGTFVADSQNMKNEDSDAKEISSTSGRNPLVTNFNLILEKCSSVDDSCLCCITAEKDANQLMDFQQENETNLKISNKNDNLRLMIIRILERLVRQCPNIKRLSMDVPNYGGVRKVIEDCIGRLTSLKPTKVSCINGNISVRKRIMEDTSSSSLLTTDNTDNEPAPHNQSTGLANQPTTPSGTMAMTNPDQCTTIVNHNNGLEVEKEKKIDDSQTRIEVKSNQDTTTTTTGEPEPTPCLFDMSKLLGSMLGIPTSSLPPSSGSSTLQSPLSSNSSIIFNQSSSSTSTVIANPNANTTEPQDTPKLTEPHHASVVDCSMNPKTQQRTTASSSSLTTEVITYAAAAASAASTNTTPTATSNNNGNSNRLHQHHSHHVHRAGGNDIGNHHRYHHNINEGSRRTFATRSVVDGEGSAASATGDEEEATRSKYKKKQHFVPPHVADLGKPVFVTSSSASASTCKSPHKRGI